MQSIAERKDEERRHLNGLGDGDGGAEANRIKPSNHKRTGIQTQISQGREHHVAAVNARSRMSFGSTNAKVAALATK
jgi:hypothetical protein